MSTQFLISQQDNYNGDTNCLADFLTTLYTTFINDKIYVAIHDKEKDLHCHVILITSVDYTKNTLLKVFPKADIQIQRGSNKQAYEYLIHNTTKSKKDGKFQYSYDIINRINIDDEFHLKWYNLPLEKEKKFIDEKEILDNIVIDILDGVFTDFIEVLNTYKGVALKYSRSIKDLLDSLK